MRKRVPIRDFKANERRGKSKVGWIAVGYSKEDDFWYSSEGVFGSRKVALKNIQFYYPVDNAYAIKVDLDKKRMR